MVHLPNVVRDLTLDVGGKGCICESLPCALVTIDCSLPLKSPLLTHPTSWMVHLPNVVRDLTLDVGGKGCICESLINESMYQA